MNTFNTPLHAKTCETKDDEALNGQKDICSSSFFQALYKFIL